MSYKLIILAPSAGGKSTLTRYLREKTKFHIAETDEEVMKANGGDWPDDELKNKVLVPQTTREVISRNSVIYFASYIPEELIIGARKAGFKIVLLDIGIDALVDRNKKRMSVENYQDVSPFFKMQLNAFSGFAGRKLIDITLDGEKSVSDIAEAICRLASK